MTNIESIEKEVERLDDGAFAAFRAWFIEYANARWDRQIADDSDSGKLDSLVEDALSEHRQGKSTPL